MALSSYGDDVDAEVPDLANEWPLTEFVIDFGARFRKTALDFDFSESVVLQIENQTDFHVDRALLLDGKGSQIWTVVIKATYLIDETGSPTPGPDQEPVVIAPMWTGEPGKSSLLREAELTLSRPGTDVTFHASACAPGGRKAPHVDVGVSVGSLKKMLRVFGPRTWSKGIMGLRPSAPESFERIPIVWENAYGGMEVNPTTRAITMEPRNPIGRGFATQPSRLAHAALPNIEDLFCLIQSSRDHPPPVGLGPIPGNWAPRSRYGGTYDEAWMRTRMPFWPADFDPRFNQSAPEGLVSEKPLRGGETVNTVGLVPEGTFTFRLPREHLMVETRLGGQWTRQQVVLERVIVEPDHRKLVMVWAARLDCGVRGREVEKSRVLIKPRVE